MTEGEQNKARATHSLNGVVTSLTGRQTIHVTVSRLVQEPRYGKYIHRRTRLAVHDPLDKAHLGDMVEIVPCRRLSKTKSWRLSRVLRSGAAVETSAEKG